MMNGQSTGQTDRESADLSSGVTGGLTGQVGKTKYLSG